MAFEDTLFVCENCKVVHATQRTQPQECSVCGEMRFNELDSGDIL